MAELARNRSDPCCNEWTQWEKVLALLHVTVVTAFNYFCVSLHNYSHLCMFSHSSLWDVYLFTYYNFGDKDTVPNYGLTFGQIQELSPLMPPPMVWELEQFSLLVPIW